MRYLKHLLIFILLSVSMFAFKLSPDYFDKRVDGKGGSQEITFWNDSNESIRYRIYVESPEEGNPDMSKWVEVYPQILTIKPKSTGKVRVFAKVPAGAEGKEYQFYLGARTVAIPKNEGGSGAQLSMPINLRIKMYGYNGESSPAVDIKNFSFIKEGEDVKFRGTFKNDTDDVSIKAKVELIGGKTRESFSTGRIRKGTFDFDVPLKKFKNPKDIKEIIITDEMTNKEIKKIKVN